MHSDAESPGSIMSPHISQLLYPYQSSLMKNLPICVLGGIEIPSEKLVGDTNRQSHQNHNRAAEDKAKELKKLNRSMFAVHVSNPFTASSRAQQADMDVLER